MADTLKWHIGTDGASCMHDGAQISISYTPKGAHPTSFRLLIYRKGRLLLNEGGFTDINVVLARAEEVANDPAIMRPDEAQA